MATILEQNHMQGQFKSTTKRNKGRIPNSIISPLKLCLNLLWLPFKSAGAHNAPMASTLHLCPSKSPWQETELCSALMKLQSRDESELTGKSLYVKVSNGHK
ncbi:unnamed protein product [Sphagnum jensenii]|uniref:Uncharacterized protein n=1 Tax=Sphagnum jensenii TaxID=128206 RepID=A0ABP0X0X2_9BRYO